MRPANPPVGCRTETWMATKKPAPRRPAGKKTGGGQNRTVYFIFFGLIVLIAGYFLFSSPGSSKDGQKKNSEQAALASLFGGGGGSAGRTNAGDGGITGSDFWKAGVPDKPISDKDDGTGRKNSDEPELLDPVSAGNPINPQTGQPYTDSVMKQFDELRKKFPDNDIIPKRKTPEDTKKEEENRQKMFGVQTLVASGKASRDQIEQFYDFQAKPIRDRLQLLEYVMKESGSNMSSDVKEQYDKILTMNKNQLTAFEDQKRKALERK